MTASSIVFVHGAHFSGWCWLSVMERLVSRGIATHAVELPFTSFNDDVAYLQGQIHERKQHGKVTLVSTSYSGIAATAAGHEADHLVYVAARMPQAGESQAALSPNWGNPDFRACMQPDAQGTMHLTEAAGEFLFNRSPAALSDLAMRHRRSMRSEIPVAAIDEPAWLGKPSSYVVCLHDRAVRLDRQRERAALATWSTELEADHSPFFSAPDELAAFIATTHEQACS